VGIDAIKTFLARNKILAKQAQNSKDINKETLKFVFETEIAAINLILQRRFEFHDTDPETKEHTGKINFDNMKEVLHGTSYLNIKEINLLLRDYVMKFGYDEIEYANFANDLYDVRFDLARSRIMDINIKKLRDDFFTNSGFEADENGWMLIQDIRTIISNAKELTLTPCEINLILGLANHNDDGKIDINHFNGLFREVVP
jgi:Ca2+-binding EF-hand superfamily protein